MLLKAIRSQIQYLLYNKHPKAMVIECIIFVAKALINEIGLCKLSNKYSSNTLVTGQPPKMYEEITSLTFGVSTIEGIKRHGDKAVAVMLTEFAQLNDKNVFKPRDLSELS